MAAHERYIRTRLEISGEREYRDALKNINSDLKVLKSELELSKTVFEGQANSIAALESKGKALSSMYETAKEKLALVNNAYENAKTAQERYAENSEKLKQKLEEVRAKLAELEKAGHGSGKAYDDLKEKADKLGSQLDRSNNAMNIAERAAGDWQSKLNAAQGEVIKLDRAVSENTAQLNEAKASTDGCATSIDRFGQSTQDASSKTIDLGAQLKTSIESMAASALTITAIIATIRKLYDAFVDCIQTSADFETAFTGVEKTVEATVPQLEALNRELKDMATEIPVAYEEIANTAMLAGQLAIPTENIADFTRVVEGMAVATNLSAEQAATDMAKFANITGMAKDDFDRLGSAIVDLGNNSATTEADILSMAERLAATGTAVGLSESQILALATALSSLGIEAEAGGGSMSKLLKEIESSVAVYGRAAEAVEQTGMSARDLEMLADLDSKAFKTLAAELNLTSKELKNFVDQKQKLDLMAETAGMTAEAFSKLWNEDKIAALEAFLRGLDAANKSGGSMITMLEDLGITEIRQSNAVIALAGNTDLLTEANKRAGEAWEENTALATETERAYDTLNAKIEIYKNANEQYRASIGDKFKPIIEWLTEAGTQYLKLTTAANESAGAADMWITVIAKSLGPATSLVDGIKQLIDGFRELGDRSEESAEKAAGAFDTEREAAEKLARELAYGSETEREAAERRLRQAQDRIDAAQEEAISVEVLVESYQDIQDELKELEQSYEDIKASVSDTLEKQFTFANAVASANETAKTRSKKLADAQKQAAADIKEALSEAQSALKTMESEYNSAYKTALNVAKSNFGLFSEMKATVSDSITDASEEAVSSLTKTALTAAGAAADIREALKDGGDAVTEYSEKIDRAFSIGFDADFVNALKDGSEEGAEALSKLLDEYDKVISTFGEEAPEVSGFVEGINAAFTSAVENAAESAVAINDVMETAGEGVESIAERLTSSMRESAENIRDYLNDIKEATEAGFTQGFVAMLADGTDESREYLKQLLDEYNAVVETYGRGSPEAKAFVDDINSAYTDAISAQEEFAKTVADTQTGLSDSIDALKDQIAALSAAYEAASEADAANVKASAADILKALEDQAQAIEDYAANLQWALDQGFSKGFVQTLADGSQTSMETLATLRESFDDTVSKFGEGSAAASGFADDFNAQFERLHESEQTVADVCAGIQTEIETKKPELEAKAGELVDGMKTAANAQVEGYGAELGEKVSNEVSAATVKASPAATAVGETVGGILVASIASKIGTAGSTIGEAVAAQVQAAINAATASALASGASLGKAIAQGVREGLGDEGAARQIESATQTMSDWILNGFKGINGINSPAALYVETAKAIPEGVAKGIRDNARAAESEMIEFSRSLEKLYAVEIRFPSAADFDTPTSSGKQSASAVGRQVIEHTGTLRVEGVNSRGELEGVVDIVLEELKREARLV